MVKCCKIRLIIQCESTDREVSFEWSHRRISSIDSKVKTSLRDSFFYPGSERVNASSVTAPCLYPENTMRWNLIYISYIYVYSIVRLKTYKSIYLLIVEGITANSTVT